MVMPFRLAGSPAYISTFKLNVDTETPVGTFTLIVKSDSVMTASLGLRMDNPDRNISVNDGEARLQITNAFGDYALDVYTANAESPTLSFECAPVACVMQP